MELVEAAQTEHADEANNWRLYVDVVARYAGMSRFAAISTPELRARQNGDGVRSAEEILSDICRPPLPDTEPDAALVSDARKFFRTLTEAGLWEDLDQLAGSCRFVPDRSPDPLLLTRHAHLENTRGLCRALAVRMRLCAMDGNSEEFLRMLDHAQVLCRACSMTGNLFASVAASTGRGYVLREVRAAVLAGRLDKESCRLALASMNRFPPAPAKLMIECERLLALEDALAVYDKAGNTEKPGGGETPAAANSLSRAEVTAVLNKFFDAWRDSVGDDAAKRSQGRDALDSIYKRAPSSSDPLRCSPVPNVLPMAGMTGPVMARTNAEVAGTRLMLALEVYRAETGGYPASLDLLVPRFLPAIPSDPYSPERPLAYKRVDPAKEPRGRGYLLYTVGADGRDDGGTPSARPSDALLNGPSGKGFDFILNQAE